MIVKPSVMPSHMSEFCQYVFCCAPCLKDLKESDDDDDDEKGNKESLQKILFI